jgi:hypothetical protein
MSKRNTRLPQPASVGDAETSSSLEATAQRLVRLRLAPPVPRRRPQAPLGDPLPARAVVSGLDCNRFVAAGLVARYAAPASIMRARCSTTCPSPTGRDAFLWNVMLRAYVHEGSTHEALALSSVAGATAMALRHWTCSSLCW